MSCYKKWVILPMVTVQNTLIIEVSSEGSSTWRVAQLLATFLMSGLLYSEAPPANHHGKTHACTRLFLVMEETMASKGNPELICYMSKGKLDCHADRNSQIFSYKAKPCAFYFGLKIRWHPVMFPGSFKEAKIRTIKLMLKECTDDFIKHS